MWFEQDTLVQDAGISLPVVYAICDVSGSPLGCEAAGPMPPAQPKVEASCQKCQLLLVNIVGTPLTASRMTWLHPGLQFGHCRSTGLSLHARC